jgi:hypothetical protein
METGNLSTAPQQVPAEQHLYLTSTGITDLNTTRKWAMFLAVMGFIGCGIMVLIGLIIMAIPQLNLPNTGMTPVFSVAMGLLYSLIGGAYFFPAWFILRFALQLKKAFAEWSETALEGAFRNLKLNFVYVGISVIALIVLYILIIAGVAVFAIIGARRGSAL